MPPKKRKFESTFPAARIKKIMQLDDDVGRVASSVPIVISRAVEIFLQALLTKASAYATSRNAKTLTVGHIKYCIENEKQWDFLKDLTAKVPDISVCNEHEGSPKRGRKRKNSSSKVPEASVKRKPKKPESNNESEDEDEETDSSSPGSSHGPLSYTKHAPEPSPLAILQKRLTNPNSSSGSSSPSPMHSHSPPVQSPLTASVVSMAAAAPVVKPPSKASSPSPLLALANSLSHSTQPQQPTPLTIINPQTTAQQLHTFSMKTGEADDEDDEYD